MPERKRPPPTAIRSLIPSSDTDNNEEENFEVFERAPKRLTLTHTTEESEAESCSQPSELEYEECISVGSSEAPSGSAHYTESELEGYFELRDGQSDTDEDERYARLLQQQEIALARSFLPDGLIEEQLVESDGSIDMSYEALLELQENIGEVKKRGLDDSTIERLERIHYDEGLPTTTKTGENTSCVVCINEFTVGEELIKLPCAHFFHERCARHWLSVKATCPVCREAVKPRVVVLDLS